MNLMRFFRAVCVMFCVSCAFAVLSNHGHMEAVADCVAPTPIPTPTVQPASPAEIILNGDWLKHRDLLQATFHLNESITRPFKAYAVLVLPDGKMMNALGLNRPLKPVVANAPGLDARFDYPLINKNIPNNAPLGRYEVLAAFFDPAKPVTGKNDAFMLAGSAFNLVNEIPAPTPTATPIPDLTGKWSGTWEVTSPPGCSGDTGTWEATMIMAASGQLSGQYHAVGSGVAIDGDIMGYYNGAPAAWVVCDQNIGAVSYSGQVDATGKNISGTFWDGPDCYGAPAGGTFLGAKEEQP